MRRRAPLSIALGLLCGCGAPPAGVDAGAVDAASDLAPPPVCRTASAPSIRTAAMLAIGRYSPVAARLDDGRALIAAGYDFTDGIESSADLFDPRSDTVSAGMPLVAARNFAATARLTDGRLLVTGGFDPLAGSIRSAELFDPGTGEFNPSAGDLVIGREAHTATALTDGRVLIAGGLQAAGFKFYSEAELFDPSPMAFHGATMSMTAKRAYHVATALAGGPMRGQVLLVGGDSGMGELATAERFDPAAQSFAATANGLAHPAKALASALLPDGRVLVAGGANATDGTLADAAIYDPATDRFTPTAPMAMRRIAFQLTALSDGRVLASGGFSDTENPRSSTGVLELFDPTDGSWQTLPVKLAQPRHDHAALLLADCRLLIAGGQQVIGNQAPVAPTEIELLVVPARP